MAVGALLVTPLAGIMAAPSVGSSAAEAAARVEPRFDNAPRTTPQRPPTPTVLVEEGRGQVVSRDGEPSELTQPLNGADAIETLGLTGLVDLAHQTGQTPAALLDVFSNDPTAHLSPNQQLFYADPVDDHDPHTTLGGKSDPEIAFGVATLDDASYSNAVVEPYTTDVDVFALSSRPSATKKVYLDFTGHTTTGTGWNSYTGGAPIISPPFDLDGNPTSFSSTERQRIFEIWRAVAEDYAPFNVDVTTLDPGHDGLVYSGTGDVHYGVRVIVTSEDWYQPLSGFKVGGLAFVNTFRHATSPPAFVFHRNLSNSTKRIHEIASHEAGHTFGLLHHGATSGYYAGHGDWAPIMGNSLRRPVTQWSHGEYNNASRPGQDDIAIIANHVGFAGDDHGTTAETATVKTPGTTVAGLIGHRNDVDVFSITIDDGDLTTTVVPTGRPSNLLAELELRNAAGKLVAVASPDQAVGWQISATGTLAAGTYTIHVTGIGWLTPSTGFSDYGSLGAYNLTTTFEPDASAPPTTTTTTVPPTTTTTTVPPTTTTTVPPTTTTTTTVPPTTTTTPPPTTTTSPAPTTTEPEKIRPSDVPSVVDDGPVAEPMTPTRLLDTRRDGGAVRDGSVTRLVVSDQAGVNGQTSAVSLNVTAVQPEADGYLTVFPCGGEVPNVSNVNYRAGSVIANAVISKLGPNGDICIYTSATTHLLADINTAFTTSPTITPLDPARLLDTRPGATTVDRQLAGNGIRAAGTTLRIPITGRANTPNDTTAIALNITAVTPTAPGYLTIYPCDTPLPNASNLNYDTGQTIANTVITKLGPNGDICIYTSATTHLLADINTAFRG